MTSSVMFSKFILLHFTFHILFHKFIKEFASRKHCEFSPVLPQFDSAAESIRNDDVIT